MFNHGIRPARKPVEPAPPTLRVVPRLHVSTEAPPVEAAPAQVITAQCHFHSNSKPHNQVLVWRDGAWAQNSWP